ncbi:hypothetical protein V5740_01860 [Croceibacterium sp. TMG7-5b_MA50]
MYQMSDFARQSLAAAGALAITATLLVTSFAPPVPAATDSTIVAEVTA